MPAERHCPEIGRNRQRRSTNERDDIDLDDLASFIDESPLHLSPEEELESVIDFLPEDDPCSREANRILMNWERELPSLEAQRAQLAEFYFRWNFGPAAGEKVGRG